MTRFPGDDFVAREEWREEMTRGEPDARRDRPKPPAANEYIVSATAEGLEMSQGTVWRWHEISAIHLSFRWYLKHHSCYECTITGPGGHTTDLGYRAFDSSGPGRYQDLVKAIHHRLGPHAANVRFTAGSWFTWVGWLAGLVVVWTVTGLPMYVTWRIGYFSESVVMLGVMAGFVGLKSVPNLICCWPRSYGPRTLPGGFLP